MAHAHKIDFPAFAQDVQAPGKPLVYLDSAAMAQMPRAVYDAVRAHEERARANVHRGVYALSETATAAYERARECARSFVNAATAREIIFTRNTTEGINAVASSLGKTLLRSGDHVLVARAEHHSNILPWQMLADEQGIILDVVESDDTGVVSADAAHAAFTPRTRLVALSHVSHVLGSINPIAAIGRLARERGILFLVDAAQSAAHLPIDVEEIGCDFLAFSGHKMGGPTGIGVLYGREELLKEMPPFLRGGGMIRSVSFKESHWADPPSKFEAGTPNISGAIGLAAAMEYVCGVGFAEMRRVDEALTRATFARLDAIPGVKIFGPRDPALRGGVVSFSLDSVHPHDLATILDREGVAIRAGHHCAMPLMERLGVAALARASFWVYNDPTDVEALGQGIEKAIHILRAA